MAKYYSIHTQVTERIDGIDAFQDKRMTLRMDEDTDIFACQRFVKLIDEFVNEFCDSAADGSDKRFYFRLYVQSETGAIQSEWVYGGTANSAKGLRLKPNLWIDRDNAADVFFGLTDEDEA